MNPTKFFQLMIGMAFILLLLIGCGVPAATPLPATSTPVLPTVTAVPPTDTHTPMPSTATPTAVPPTTTPTVEPPTAVPTQAFTQVTSAEEVLGTWSVGTYYIRFDEDGTFRQAHALETLDSQPYAISSYDFEGTKMVTVQISVSGVPSCGNQTGSYELRLRENGNLQILVIEDRCTGRAHDTAGEYRPVR
jgi:hypothetical protein